MLVPPMVPAPGAGNVTGSPPARVPRWDPVAPSAPRAGLLVAGAAGLAAAAYAAPSVARLLPPRLRATPGLSGLGDPGHVALTFDDGPDPRSTPAVVEALAGLGWSATFFCLGTMTAAGPSP